MANEDFWDKAADAVLAIALMAGFAFFVIVLGWQTVNWLKTSQWQELPFLVALEFAGFSTESVYAPTSWFGLAKAAQFVLALPMSIMVPACAAALAFAIKAFVNSGTAQ